MTANQSGRSAHHTRQLLAWAATVLVLAGCGTPKEAKQEGPAKSPAKQPSQDPLAGSAKQPSEAASGNPAQQPSVAEAEDPVTEPVRIEITAAWPGASPVDIEELLVYPVEMAVASLARLKTTRADILQSVAKITLTLEDGADADDRLLAVSAALQALDKLPYGAEEFQLRILPQAQAPPVWIVWTSRPQAKPLSSTKMQELRDRITRIPHVGEVRVYGTRKSYLEVVVDDDALSRFGITFEATKAAIDRRQRALPDRLRSARSPATVEELEDIVLKPSEPPVTLRQVAKIRLASRDRFPTHWNGQTSSALRVSLTASVPSSGRSDFEGQLLSRFQEWTKDPELEGEFSLAFPDVGVDLHANIYFPAGTSPDVQQRILDLARKELRDLTDKRDRLLIESADTIDLFIGGVSEPQVLAAKVYKRLNSLPGVHVTVVNLRGAPRPIVARVSGPKIESLRKWSQDVSKQVHEFAGVTGVKILGLRTAPELEVVIKAEAANRLGLDKATLASRLRQMLISSNPTSDAENGRPILVRRETDTGELGDFSKMKIALPDGTQVPISQVAQLSLRETPQNVVRVDLQRSVEIHIQAESRARQKGIRQALPEIFSSTRSADLDGSFRFQID